jgi:hypothetical protein
MKPQTDCVAKIRIYLIFKAVNVNNNYITEIIIMIIITLSSPLYKVFTILHLKQTTFLGYAMYNVYSGNNNSNNNNNNNNNYTKAIIIIIYHLYTTYLQLHT